MKHAKRLVKAAKSGRALGATVNISVHPVCVQAEKILVLELTELLGEPVAEHKCTVFRVDTNEITIFKRGEW